MKIFKYVLISIMVILGSFTFWYFTFGSKIKFFSNKPIDEPILEQLFGFINAIGWAIYGIIEIIKDIRKNKKDV